MKQKKKQNQFHYSQQAYLPTMQIYYKFASQLQKRLIKQEAGFPRKPDFFYNALNNRYLLTAHALPGCRIPYANCR